MAFISKCENKVFFSRMYLLLSVWEHFPPNHIADRLTDWLLFVRIRVRFFKEIQDWIFKSEKNPTMDFAFLYWTDQSKIFRIMVCQTNRRIHFQSGFFGSFEAPWSKRSWIDLFSKETQDPFSDSFGFKTPILDFLKETHPYWIRASKKLNWDGKTKAITISYQRIRSKSVR